MDKKLTEMIVSSQFVTANDFQIADVAGSRRGTTRKSDFSRGTIGRDRHPAFMGIVRLVFRYSSGHVLHAWPPGIDIRQASPRGDAMSIRTLVDSSHEGGGYIPQASGLLAELASGPRRSVTSWLAVHDDHPVGLAALVSAGPEAAARHSIAWLLVSGRTRRRGVGSALVATALQAASARGAREVWAETRADWSAAIAFWSAVGFRPVA